MAEDKNNPLVSIVTPVYNAEDFILETIQSVKSQSYQNWELLLIDDKSEDSSVELIKSEIANDKRIKLISNETNLGAAVSRNKGTMSSTGRFLAFLDADDIWLPGKLSTQVRFMQENGYSFTYTSYKFANRNLSALGKPVSVPKTINYSQALKNHIIWTSTVMLDLGKINKDIIMMPDIKRGQDAATWWQILRHVKTAYGVQEVLSYYRRTTHSLSSNKFKAMKRTWFLLTKVENLNTLQSSYYFVWYAVSAVRKRI